MMMKHLGGIKDNIGDSLDLVSLVFVLGRSVRLGERGAREPEGPEPVGLHTEDQSLVGVQVSAALTGVPS